MTFAVGSLVQARGREWVVLPESDGEMLVLRPLGGAQDEVTGIYLPLERVDPARFDLPDPERPGDYRSSRLLRDAVRLGFRSSAGPFRSFARIAVEPRPYQLVPLLMALKQDPVRILIADDVGIGKTVEAGLIARELLDRGEVRRLAVLCPPHLAEQWQRELSSKFHIEAELVLASTATRLERACRVGESLFDVYPFVIVSTDFIKSDRRREEFRRTCPELVIVDEAHTCASSGEERGSRHQRHQLVAGLAKDANRHLVLVTATPHSGNEDAFRSLLAFLDPEFAELPDDLSGTQNEPHRRRLAAYFVQRRRADIRHYMQADTPFPEREEKELAYRLSPEYRAFFQKVLRYVRETVRDGSGSALRQRVRWWSALALLRSVASSPAAASATLRSRAAGADAETTDEVDEIGRQTVLDLADDEAAETVDVAPGAESGEDGGEPGRGHRRLLELALEADALAGADEKLLQATAIVQKLLRDGFNPIVFCRFIPTAEYVATELRSRLAREFKDLEVDAVTGRLPADERERRVQQLEKAVRRLLVATDCLSEGINLQDGFDAVLHYDLSWNPTRHEQREGRVDRYGQPQPKVRALTFYGSDNLIDEIVLNVLIRKEKAIRHALGVSVPVPSGTTRVIEAVMEGVMEQTPEQQSLPGMEAFLKPHTLDMFREWENASERERRSRTMFAQESIRVDEVQRELEAVREAIGSGVDVARFVREALRAYGATVTVTNDAKGELLIASLAEAPQALREQTGLEHLRARFELPVAEGELYLERTHPFVEGLAAYIMDTALDPIASSPAARCGVIRTDGVERRTTLLLVRIRYHIVTRRDDRDLPLLAEDCLLLGFEGSPVNAAWQEGDAVERLPGLAPTQNTMPEQARDLVQRVVENADALAPHLESVARRRGEELLEAHRRVRTAARWRGVSQSVEAQLPPDLLGIYVYVPG